MLCEIKCLKESVNLIIKVSFDVIKVNDYKYHSSITMVIYNGLPTSMLLELQTPFIYSPVLTDATTLNLYNKNSELVTQTVITKLKPINWKLQHQRHQVAKLLQITG
jgi:hypothetical protein